MLSINKSTLLSFTIFLALGAPLASQTDLVDNFDQGGSSTSISSKGQSRCIKAAVDFNRWLSQSGAKVKETPFQDFSDNIVSGEISHFKDRAGVSHKTAVVHATSKSYPHRLKEVRFPISEEAKIMKVTLAGETFSVHMKGSCATIVAGDNHSSQFMCGNEKRVKVDSFTENPKMGHFMYSSPSGISTDRKVLELMERIKDKHQSAVAEFPLANDTSLSSRNFKSCLKNNTTSRFDSLAIYNELFPSKKIAPSDSKGSQPFHTRTASK